MLLNIIGEPKDTESVFCYIPNFITDKEIKKLKTTLSHIEFIPNYNYTETKIIRYQKWYQQDNKYFCNKWGNKYKRWESNEYFTELVNFQKLITARLKQYNFEKLGINIPDFNSCLINKYLENNYIRPHRDTDKAFGKEPCIVGISIGSPAKISFKRVLYKGHNKGMSKQDKKNNFLNFSWNLEPNSVFIMAGSSQKYWTHEVEKNNNKDTRISLTFRKQI